MKRKTQITMGILLLSLMSISARGQETQDVIATATYNVTHLRDTIDSSRISNEMMILYIGKTASMYQSYKKLVRDSSLLAAGSGFSRKDPVTGITTMSMPPNLAGPIDRTIIYNYPREGQWFQYEPVSIKSFIYSTDRPDFNWKISDETKTIEGLTCQKAVGFWKGRTYIAWFAPDLPFSYGPWKLNGLPGLIIEAADSRGHITFEFGGFRTNANKDRRIAVPAGATVISQTDFDKLKKAHDDDPFGYLERNHGITAKPMPGMPIPQPRPKPNNPMELPGY